MIEKPKRPKKIPNQDNKQPQTIQELIRRYDLDNTKIYDFLDELVGTLNKKDTYSTEEQVIGTWIDGKPLYRKVLVGTVPTVSESGTWNSVDVPIGVENINAKTAHVVDAFFYQTIGDACITLPFFSNSDNRVKALVTSSGNVNIASNGHAFNGCTAYVTIQYTKTID